MQPRSEFPDLYTVDGKLHFNNNVADLAYDSMISKAREEALEKFGPNWFVLIVCAGWNAEGNQITSMKEAFCAKQLSLCRTTIGLIRWAKMNSGCCWKYEYGLVSMPKVLYQTNRRDHEKLQRLSVAALCQSDQRRFARVGFDTNPYSDASEAYQQTAFDTKSSAATRQESKQH